MAYATKVCPAAVSSRSAGQVAGRQVTLQNCGCMPLKSELHAPRCTPSRLRPLPRPLLSCSNGELHLGQLHRDWPRLHTLTSSPNLIHECLTLVGFQMFVLTCGDGVLLVLLPVLRHILCQRVIRIGR